MVVWADERWWAQQPGGYWTLWDPQRNQWVPTDRSPSPGGQVAPVRPNQQQYEPIAGLVPWLVLLLVASAVVSALSLIGDVWQLDLAGRVPEDSPVPLDMRDEIEANNRRQSLGDALQALLILATAPVFLVWFHRAYSNLLHLGVGRLRYSTGWAVGGWFVPVLAYWRPKELANDIWRASDPEQPITAWLTWTKKPVTFWLHLWWGAFVAAWILGWSEFVRFGFFFSAGDPEVDTLKVLLADLAMIIAAVAAIFVVRRTTERQRARERAMPTLGYERMVG